MVSPQAFLDFVGHHLLQEAFLEMPVLTGEELHDAGMAKKSTAGGKDGWAWSEVKALSLSWFVGLAQVLRQIESAGKWPQGTPRCLCCHDSSRQRVTVPRFEQRSLCVRLAHIQEWLFRNGFTPGSPTQRSMFSAAKEFPLLTRGIPPLLTLKRFSATHHQGEFHIFVADVVKSFDTVDRDILDCALGRLRLPACMVFAGCTSLSTEKFLFDSN